jgi:hypothetical protein
MLRRSGGRKGDRVDEQSFDEFYAPGRLLTRDVIRRG